MNNKKPVAIVLGGIFPHAEVVRKLKNRGYYTVDLEEAVELQPGQRFAVILHVKTPGAVHPLAIEYQADDATRDVILADGEGYISARGQMWESTERVHGCNLCLKAYTRVRED